MVTTKNSIQDNRITFAQDLNALPAEDESKEMMPAPLSSKREMMLYEISKKGQLSYQGYQANIN